MGGFVHFPEVPTSANGCRTGSLCEARKTRVALRAALDELFPDVDEVEHVDPREL